MLKILHNFFITSLLALFITVSSAWADQAARIFVSIDPEESEQKPSWEIAKELGMRLPLGGMLTTKAYQNIYSEAHNQALVIGLSSSARPAPYVIKKSRLGSFELLITEIFPAASVDDMILAYLEAKRKFGKMPSEQNHLHMLVLHAPESDDGCEEFEGKLDCPLQSQLHRFLRRLPPTRIDLIVRAGHRTVMSPIKNGFYLEVPRNGNYAFDINIDNNKHISAQPIPLCKYVSRHSEVCRPEKMGGQQFSPASFLGRSVQRQINTLLSSQTVLSPGLQNPATDSL